MSKALDAMAEIANLPRVRLACLPTPLQPLATLAKDAGVEELWIKRDDLTGLAFGGNKTRKLEFIIAEALASGADSIITVGALQSNHCRQTAAAAARTGLACTLVLTGEAPDTLSGNLLLDRLLDAELVFSPETDPHMALRQVVRDMSQRGQKPFVVPYGGTSPAGMVSYSLALRELLEQNPKIDRIVIATSSGGTQAGLVLGAKLLGFVGKITGISVDRSAAFLRPLLADLANQAALGMGHPGGFEPSRFEVVDRYLGGGYAVVGELEINAIQRVAKKEGILLDPVYTARAAGGLLDMIERGEIPAEERIVFWHTGGTPALFAYPPLES